MIKEMNKYNAVFFALFVLSQIALVSLIITFVTIKRHEIPNIKGYVYSFNENDLKVRHCQSKSECMFKYLKGLRNPSLVEKLQLKKYIKFINTVINPQSTFGKIPWNVIMFDPESESGYPHTHDIYIMLPYGFLQKPSSTVIKTLLHEKIHVYQRVYPFHFLDLYQNYQKLSIVGFQDINHVRHNPDTNALLFQDEQGNSFEPKWVPNPRNLSDIQDPRDHPNEMIAYLLPDLLLEGTQNTWENHKEIHMWAKKYMII